LSFSQVDIGNVVEKISTWNPLQSNLEEVFTYIDLSSIDKDKKTIDCSVVPCVNTKDAPSRARQLVKKSDILISTVRPNLNGVAIVPSHLNGATASTGYCVLRAKQAELVPLYLFYWVQTKTFICDMVSKATGANYPAVSDKTIKQSKIPLPLLKVQKKIADILDAAGSLRQKDLQLVEHYNRLSQSLFLDMFGEHYTHLTPLKNLVTFSQGQQFPVEEQYTEPREGYARFLRIVDYTQKDDFRYVPNGNDNDRYHVGIDDIVIVRYGASAGFVGKNKKGVLANNLFKVNFDKAKFNHTFMFYMFLQNPFKQFVKKEAFGAAMPALSFKVMEKFEIPTPPLLLQEKFAQLIQSIDTQKKLAQQNLQKSDDLFNSLLQKAFKGELTAS